jgi:hypothetical protein
MFDVVFLGETLSWLNWLGIALIGAGAVLVAYQRERTKPPRGGSQNPCFLLEQLERAKGFEPSTSTLARLRSTPELRPQRSHRTSSRPAR